MGSKKTADTTADLVGHLYSMAWAAAVKGRRSWSTQSIEEKIAVAIALNRADWLNALGYTLAQAVGAMESSWIAMMPVLVDRLQKDLGRSPERLGMTPRKSSKASLNQLDLFEKYEEEECND